MEHLNSIHVNDPWCITFEWEEGEAQRDTKDYIRWLKNCGFVFLKIGALGVGFASESFLIPLLILIGFVTYYPFVIKSEEAELAKLYKNEFEMYYKKVPKFFPKISYLTEPEEYIVKPVVFKRHMFSALWFIWFMGILEIIEELHELKVLPTIFNIY